MSTFQVTYKDVHALVKTIAASIQSEYDPQVIIGIAGGGLVPARILRSFLKIPLISVSLALYKPCKKGEEGYEEGEEVRGEKVDVYQWLDAHALDLVKGKRVLVVDEIHDSGETLKFCIDKLGETCKAKSLAAAVLHHKNVPKVHDLKTENDIPFFIGQEIEDIWVVYPWSHPDVEEEKSTESSMCLLS